MIGLSSWVVIHALGIGLEAHVLGLVFGRKDFQPISICIP